MKIKKNTEKAVIAAMEEMTQAGIPVKEFSGMSDTDRSCDFIFRRKLTQEQKKKAAEIASKYLDCEWSF